MGPVFRFRLSHWFYYLLEAAPLFLVPNVRPLTAHIAGLLGLNQTVHIAFTDTQPVSAQQRARDSARDASLQESGLWDQGHEVVLL